jgi:integrase
MATVTKHRGKWVIDYRDTAGRRHVVRKGKDGVAFRTRKEADDALAEIVKRGRKTETKITFQDYAEWWLENCAKDQIKDSTFEEYQSALKNHLYPTFGNRPMAKITRMEAREFINHERKTGWRISEIRRLEKVRDRLSLETGDEAAAAKRKVEARLLQHQQAGKKDLSRSTVRNLLAPARSMFNQAIEDEIVSSNPFANIGRINKKDNSDPEKAEELKEENVYDMSQVARALDMAKERKPQHHPVFACGFLSGLRMGEQIALRPIDIDFETHNIHVRRNFYRGRITTPKGNRRRRVVLEPELEAILDNLIKSKKAAAIESLLSKPADERRDKEEIMKEMMEDYLFKTPIGTRLDPSNLRRAFHSVLKAAGLRRIRYHDMRHTYATNLLNQGVDIAEVSRLLGHASIKITLDTYIHFLPQKEGRVSILSTALAAAQQENGKPRDDLLQNGYI